MQVTMEWTYCSFNVAFLFTDRPNEPPSRQLNSTSKNGAFFFDYTSVVNFALWLAELDLFGNRLILEECLSMQKCKLHKVCTDKVCGLTIHVDHVPTLP